VYCADGAAGTFNTAALRGGIADAVGEVFLFALQPAATATHAHSDAETIHFTGSLLARSAGKTEPGLVNPSDARSRAAMEAFIGRLPFDA
jgi:hypothetical protein